MEIPDVVIVGSIGYDDIETIYGKKERVLGGSLSHAAFGASFFCKVGIVGVVGRDFDQQHLELFKNRGICTKGLKIENGNTFYWCGAYDEFNNPKTLKIDLGVFQNFRPELPEEYKKVKYLFLANISPELQNHVLSQIENPEIIVLDTRARWINERRDELMDVIKKVDILTINDEEARLLFGNNLIKAGKEIIKLGLSAAIIKKGEHGSLLFMKDKIFSIPAYPIENVKDPTGAGDSFAGALIGFLSQVGFNEENMKKAIAYASVIASFNIEDFSLDNLKNLTREEIEKRYNELKEITRI